MHTFTGVCTLKFNPIHTKEGGWGNRKEEVEEAQHEGIKIIYQAAPIEFHGKGKVEKVRCVKMKFADKKGSRKSKLVPLENSDFEVKTDAVIIAIGYEIEDFRFATDFS